MSADTNNDGSVPPKVDPLNGDEAARQAAWTQKTEPMAREEEAKEKTARISLEDAVAPEEEAAPGKPAPKTIRLKRPGSPSTVRLPRPGGEEEPEETPASDLEAPKHMTSRIVLPEPEAAEGSAKSATQRIEIPSSAPTDTGQPTRKKTIRIKRPEAPSTVRSVTIARTAKETHKTKEISAETDEPGVLFLLLSIAATIVLAVLVYVLVTQAFPELGLKWANQIHV